MVKGWIVPIDEIDELGKVYNRLQAWAQNERLWASRMPDGLEADAKINRAKNYEALLPAIEKAIDRLRKPSELVTDDSGALALPYALLGIAGYMVYWMISHGIFHALTALQGGR